MVLKLCSSMPLFTLNLQNTVKQRYWTLGFRIRHMMWKTPSQCETNINGYTNGLAFDYYVNDACDTSLFCCSDCQINDHMHKNISICNSKCFLCLSNRGLNLLFLNYRLKNHKCFLNFYAGSCDLFWPSCRLQPSSRVHPK